MAESQDMLALKAKQEAYKKRMMEAGPRAKQDAFKGQMRAAAPEKPWWKATLCDLLRCRGP